MSRNSSNHYSTLAAPDTFLFSMFLFLHGLIHAAGMGYLGGPLWLICGGLFILAATLVYHHNPLWIVVFIVSFILSEILILVSWAEARWGFWINIALLIFAVGKAAAARFDYQTRHLTDSLFENLYTGAVPAVTKEAVDRLPGPVRKWLYRTAILQHPVSFLVHVKQEGQLRLRPGGKWFSFDAEQYTLPWSLAFIWKARVRLNSLMWLRGRDLLYNRKAGMLIKLFGLIKIVDKKNSPDLRMAALTRIFGEMAWCPALALHKSISWRSLNDSTAEATLEHAGFIITGKFSFDTSGDLTGFSALRLFISGKEQCLRHWVVEMSHYQDYHGIRLPSHYVVIWKLPNRDFTWLQFNLKKLDYNKPYLFRKRYNREYLSFQPGSPSSLTRHGVANDASTNPQ